MSALSGVRVLDLSRLLPGPFATGVLADLGASVDKIEDPHGGDYLRGLLHLPDHSLRGRLRSYAQDHGVVLPASVYQPF